MVEHAPLRLDATRLEAVCTLWKATGREFVARFSGRSMEPTIHSGDELRLLCGAACAPGDVVVYRNGDGLILHRLEGMDARGRWWLIRGDGCLVHDQLLTDGSLLFARVVSVRREGQEEHPLAEPPGGRVRMLLSGLARTALAVSPTLGRRFISMVRAAYRPTLPTTSIENVLG